MQFATEPAKTYLSALKERHGENVSTYFEALVKRSGVDTGANEATISRMHSLRRKLAQTNGERQKYRALRGFFITLCVLFALAGVITGLVFAGRVLYLGILLPILCALAMAGLIVVIVLVFKPKISRVDTLAGELSSTLGALERQGWAQMYALNALFASSMIEEIAEETLPGLHFDRTFDANKFYYFSERYNLAQWHGAGRSTLGIRTGHLGGNPFLITKWLSQGMRMQSYHGSLTVSWEEYGSDGETLISRSETLHASVQHEAPYYTVDSAFFFGNDAAPNLHFSRFPQGISAEGKARERALKKGEREIEKLGRRAVAQGGQFTQLANSEFEVCFHALNRDDEVAFRLLYTPLAQQNTIALMKAPHPFGDYFRMEKRGRVNVIRTDGDGLCAVVPDPLGFASYDFREIKRRFFAGNAAFFEELYRNLAPLLCIPLYTERSAEHDFTDKECAEVWTDEYLEALCNRLPLRDIEPFDADTQTICRATSLGRDERGELIEVCAEAFHAVQRVDYVSVSASNGNVYEVSVPWVEYIPTSRITRFLARRPETGQAQVEGQFGRDAVLINGVSIIAI